MESFPMEIFPKARIGNEKPGSLGSPSNWTLDQGDQTHKHKEMSGGITPSALFDVRHSLEYTSSLMVNYP